MSITILYEVIIIKINKKEGKKLQFKAITSGFTCNILDTGSEAVCDVNLAHLRHPEYSTSPCTLISMAFIRPLSTLSPPTTGPLFMPTLLPRKFCFSLIPFHQTAFLPVPQVLLRCRSFNYFQWFSSLLSYC